jgi:hypothetical protein
MTTTAGRALLDWWGKRDEADPDPTWRESKVAAIEREAYEQAKADAIAAVEARALGTNGLLSRSAVLAAIRLLKP